MMRRRIPVKSPLTIFSTKKEPKQYFNYLLVLDFEATCKEVEKLEPQEIIEIPCAAVSTKTWQVENVFHEYVKPRIHPELSPFCVKLTGIIQDMVDKQPHFPQVFDQFNEWIKKNGYFTDEKKSTFVTSGEWDLKVMLPKQCALDKIPVPEYYKKWINLKDIYMDCTSHYPRNLLSMITELGLTHEGHLHSGIDDVNNMVQIIQTLHKLYDVQFRINTSPDAILDYLRNNLKLPNNSRRLSSRKGVKF